MRIACLQFAPRVGDVSNNLNRADAVLNRAGIEDIDLLVLPELAFSGYNFRSLQEISPFLEPTAAGITSLWARTTALKYNCFVVAGYPEKVDITPKWPANPEYYNSAIMVNRDGETVANYRKSFLYYTDETWALEGPSGFFHGRISGLGDVAMGICMDLNPYKFEAPWSAMEFANHILHRSPNLVIISMAWLTREEAGPYSRWPQEPDMKTLSYWLARLEPIIREEGEDEIIFIFANRSGIEEEAVYAGTSAILGIQSGEVKVYGILGRGERELLVVDTNKRPQMMLVSETQPLVVEKPRKSYVEAGSSTALDFKFDSPRNLDSTLSIDTAYTSLEPHTTVPTIDKVSMTPTSPEENGVSQAYYSTHSGAKPRKSTPVPAIKSHDSINSHQDLHRRGRSPEMQRRGTPSADGQHRSTQTQQEGRQQQVSTPVYIRPYSPKSRNTSRNQSRMSNGRMQSPLISESPFVDHNQITPPLLKDEDEIHRILQDINDDDEIVAIESDSDIIAIIDEKENRRRAALVAHSQGSSPEITNIDCHSVMPESRPVRAETAHDRQVDIGDTDDDEEWESSFLKNSLGPRSKHISPRPSSMLW